MMTFLCYPKCTTCQKARKWLDENQIAYAFRNIKTEYPAYEELAEWPAAEEILQYQRSAV